MNNFILLNEESLFSVYLMYSSKITLHSDAAVFTALFELICRQHVVFVSLSICPLILLKI